jgi:uncharacterized membrane protein YeaQ/YmgE (transglycosylase-associated protein family)
MGGIWDFIGWILVGGIAGYIASLLLKAQRQGCLINIIIGIAGAFVGGFLMNLVLPNGLLPGVPFINTIINATLGAVVLLIALEIFLPGKQLGNDDDGGGRRRRR